MIDPPIWTAEQLQSEAERSAAFFRKERLEEPLEAYLESFEDYQGVVEELLETTVDLTLLDENAEQFLTDRRLLEAFRYLAGPPISADDLKTLAEAQSLTAARLRSGPDVLQRIVEVVQTCLDRRRFQWVVDHREPSEAEKSAAVLATAALMATRRVETQRRNQGKQKQEDRVQATLVRAGFRKVAGRHIRTLAEAPEVGEFCGECRFGNRKGDFIVRLWDQRVVPIECKVSNSATNSVKRLNNDASIKAEVWRQDFGTRNVVPTAVLSGVYKLHNLRDAQSRGLAIFWAHDIEAMIAWTKRTRRDEQ